MSEKAKKQVMLTQYFDLLTPINPLQLQQILHFSVFGLFDCVLRMQNLNKIGILTKYCTMHACWVLAAASVHYSIRSCNVCLSNHLACIL